MEKQTLSCMNLWCSFKKVYLALMVFFYKKYSLAYIFPMYSFKKIKNLKLAFAFLHLWLLWCMVLTYVKKKENVYMEHFKIHEYSSWTMPWYYTPLQRKKYILRSKALKNNSFSFMCNISFEYFPKARCCFFIILCYSQKKNLCVMNL